MQRLIFWCMLIILCFIYIVTLSRYGTVIPPFWPPEEISQVVFVESWVTGKPRRISFAPSSETEVKSSQTTQRRVYPLIVYTSSLSLWGKIFGFSISSMRWFNRVLGALGLVLVFILARCWNVPTWLAFTTATWVGMDITYQLIGNFLRPEILCVVLMLTGLLAFTKGWEISKVLWFLVAGLFFALSMLTHPLLGMTTTLSLLAYLCLHRQWRTSLSFLSPLLLFGILVILYTGNPNTIAEQLFKFGQYLIEDKTPKSLAEFLFLLLGCRTLQSVYDLYPSNTPIWFAILVIAAMGQRKSHLQLHGWQLTFITVAYLTTALGGHPWYFGWFAPVGYLLTALIFTQFIRMVSKPLGLTFLIAFMLTWVGYQASKVLPCWQAVPTIHRAYEEFFFDLARQLPPESKVVIYCVPDPSFYLVKNRPDVKIYIPTGSKTSHNQWKKMFGELDGFVVMEIDWVFTKPVVILPEKYRVVRRWRIPSVRVTYSVVWLETSPKRQRASTLK